MSIDQVRDQNIANIVKKCTGWLEQEPKRLQTEGIFRVSGSAKGMESLLERLEQEAATGRKDTVDLDSENVHTVAGVLKRGLMKLEPCLLPDSTFDTLIGTLDLSPLEMVAQLREAIQTLPSHRLQLLRHVVAFLRQAAKQQGCSRMGVSNLCKVFAASLLRHSNDLTTVLNLGCGRLPKIAAVMVVSNGVLELEVPASQKDMEALVRKQLQELDDTNCPKFGGPAAAGREGGSGDLNEAGSGDLNEACQAGEPAAHGAPDGTATGGNHRTSILSKFSWRRQSPADYEDSHDDARRSGGSNDAPSPWLGGSWTVIPSLPRMPRLVSGWIGVQLPWELPSSPQTPEARPLDPHWPKGVTEVQRGSRDRSAVAQTAESAGEYV
mmetsp:Transcript_97335/g.142451  ORF Transcript_97335/g.142451 Transcript_97335/m.142451 type:complete len:381 (-) Transcript_97335:1300-2442(-)|eukprot:CAMPEP_0179432384 /NCGR_PEP_ID=MMETSP0799-20121207/17010_1 /TAXON_ID=46947 /ORGANISM="Geminigera cryophila, Strain CCMP2564" /LENGTH=380 /DNA_ID=CAMNT_0021209733 /DNA_START=26 /DNA_END=1168 /DNA_ORIENTATION=+